MNSCLVSLQCAVSHGPEDSIFVKMIFYKKNSYRLSLQRNSRMILTVIQHTEWFCTLMAGNGFLSTVNSRTNLENVQYFKWFCTQKAPEGILPCAHSQMILTDVLSCMLLKPTQHTKWFCALKAVVGILIRVYSFHVVHKDTFLWKPSFTK